MKSFYYNSSQITKDKKKRAIFLKNEILRYSLGLLFESNFSKMRINEKIFIVGFQSMGSFKNHCLLTGRSNSIFQRFRLSRIAFREKTSIGVISGIKRSA
tara:strand:+ start:470 stop:769 length:300 start_codon:yes stop_codon:yes gene_type:complete